MNIDEFMDIADARLSRFGDLARRPLAEMREHLTDAASTLAKTSPNAEQAQALAVEQFGDPQVVADALARELGNDRVPVERAFKLICLANLFIALSGFAIAAMLNPTGPLLTATGTMSLVVLVAAVIALKPDPARGTLLVTGVALIAFGAAGLLLALARTPATPKFGVLAFATALLVQGTLAVFVGRRRAGAPAESAIPA